MVSMAWEILTVAAVFFGIGFASGFYTAGILERADKADVRLYISLLVAVVWASSVAAGIIVPTYEPSLALHAIMGAVAGYFFKTANPITGNGNGSNDNEDEGK